MEQLFFYILVSNFSALLLFKMNVLDILDMGDFFQILSQSTEILIESNFWLVMFVRGIYP